MRLFVALMRRKHMPPGHIWRGKKRLYEEVTGKHLRELKDRFEIEEKNMFYLRHAYLTPQESSGHARALGKNEANVKKTMDNHKPYFANVTIEERLGHMRHSERWE